MTRTTLAGRARSSRASRAHGRWSRTASSAGRPRTSPSSSSGTALNRTETVTREFVIWHLMEHDAHHTGEMSLILGKHGVQSLDL